ncbi:MAG: HPr family phosphocarrier protein [Lachnospiraceae bacterium]
MKREKVISSMSFEKDGQQIAKLVQLAESFTSSIYLVEGEKTINAKSIMGMMTLNLLYGEEATIVADGEDEERAIQQLVEFLTD